jgi:NitT/TauT family transport system permease protein
LWSIAYNSGLTLARSMAGFLLGLVAAVLLGYLYTLHWLLREAVRALNVVLQSVSVLVWIIVFLMLFGVFSPLPPTLVGAMVSLPIILSSIVSGLESASRRLVELAAVLGAPRWRVYPDFLLPSLVPQLAGAARAAMGAALRISVVAEAMGASGGIGYMIENYYSLAEPVGVFAWGILLVALMIFLDQLVLARLEGWAKSWAILPQR